MKVSVVVPVYKVELWLDRCVRSILGQTHADFELLLVDDGSPDRCGEMCDAWAERDARIRTFHKPNGGLSSARNFGMERSSGRAISFVDSDDYVEPQYLEELVRSLESDDAADYAEVAVAVERGGRRQPRDASGARRAYDTAEALKATLYDRPLFTSACAKLFRREFILRWRFPEGRLYEEIALAADYMPAARKVAYCGEPLYVYAIRESSITTVPFVSARLPEHLAAADALALAAERHSASLHAAALRFRVYARLRALRICRSGDAAERAFERSAIGFVRAHGGEVLADPEAPARDRLAIRLLRLGLAVYRFSWNVYARMRK